MSLFDLLQSVGGRLGILEAPGTSCPGQPAKVTTRTVTLAELKSEIRSEEVRALAELPAELTLPFEKIFEAAGVATPAQGWSVGKLKELLAAEPFRALEPAAAQQALLDRLRAEGVPAEALVREAVAQDQALDAFEVFVRKKAEERRAAAEHRIAEVEASIRSLQAEQARLREQVRVEQDRLSRWQRSKCAFERDLAATIRHLTDRPVISSDTQEPPE